MQAELADPLTLLIGANDPRVKEVERVGKELLCTVDYPLPDGAPDEYHLTIRRFGSRLTVKEQMPGTKLPARCPLRHINSDGTFCLGFAPTAPKTPSSQHEAIVWWQTLFGFLELQQYAHHTRRWRGREWRHGDAALWQYVEEEARMHLPQSISLHGVVAKFEAQQLVKLHEKVADALTSGKSASDQIKRFAASLRMEHRRAPCPCGSRKEIRKCGNHERWLAALSIAISLADLSEAKYWADWHHACCGTMEACPALEKCHPSKK